MLSHCKEPRGIIYEYVRFQVFKAVTMKDAAFRDVRTCGIISLQRASVASYCWFCFLPADSFDPDDGYDMFLRNVGSYKIQPHHIPEDDIYYIRVFRSWTLSIVMSIMNDGLSPEFWVILIYHRHKPIEWYMFAILNFIETCSWVLKYSLQATYEIRQVFKSSLSPLQSRRVY
jgi:hypothetical protein